MMIRRPLPRSKVPTQAAREPMRISKAILANTQDFVTPRQGMTDQDLKAMYAAPKTMGYTREAELAMDHALEQCGWTSLLSHAINMGYNAGKIAPQFLGYQYLAGLAQDPLIRAGVCTVADDMTRKWVRITRKGITDEHELDGDEKVKTLTSAMDDFGIRELFNEAAQRCDFDGGCQLFIDTGVRKQNLLAAPLVMSPLTLKGQVRRLTLIDAIVTYPGLYQALNPLDPDYFQPSHWLVLGRRVHKSRFLYFAPNQLPLYLRPSYNFYGIPAAQQALDYLTHFEKTREAAQRLLTKFSLTVLKTNMTGILNGGDDKELRGRVDYFTQYRDNDGTEIIDNETEDILQINTPLSGVIDVPRQALEFVASIFRIPITKYLGISPAGMNATGESDARNYDEHVMSKQGKIFLQPLKRVLDVLQMHLFGEIDPLITFEFIPLNDEDDSQTALTFKTKVDAAAVLFDRGACDAEDLRLFASQDETSPFRFIDPEELPEAPENPSFGEEDEDGHIAGTGVTVREDDTAGEVRAMDEFNESKVKRDDSGKFSEQEGGNAKKSESEYKKQTISVDDIQKTIEENPGKVFVRWSRGPLYDLAQGANSKDYSSGKMHNGLSAVELDGTSKGDILKRIAEYEYFKSDDPKRQPYIYIGERSGTDSDGSPSIRPTKYVGTLKKKDIENIGVASKIEVLKESIAKEERRLLNISDQMAARITKEDIRKKVAALKDLEENGKQAEIRILRGHKY